MYFLNKFAKFKETTAIVLLTVNFCCANEANKVPSRLESAVTTLEENSTTKWNNETSPRDFPPLEKPVITFERNSIAKWKNITGSDEDSDLSFYSEKGEVLYASCSAPYPIDWKFNGFINPVSILRIREPERTYNPDKFTIRLAAFFNTAEDEPSLAASLRIICKELDYFETSAFFLYVKGNRNETLLPSKTDEKVNAAYIPCPTTTPQEPVNLIKLNGMEEVKVEEGVIYEPSSGFGLNYIGLFEEGIYLCRQGSSEVRLTVKRSPQYQKEKRNGTDQTEEHIRRFSDEDIFISCSSKLNKKVELKFDQDSQSKLNITYRYSITEDIIATLTLLDKNLKRVEGKVSCLEEGVPVINWTFEFIKAPEIFFDDYFSEMHCLTDFEEGDGVEVEAKSVRCSNAIGCSYYERCLEEGSACDHLGQVVYSDKRRSQCAPLADRKVRDCVNLYYTSWNGVAQCKVDGLTRNWPYFTALDLHKYTDWKKVKMSNLLRLEKEASKNEESHDGFRCTGVGFLFANSLGFEITYRNGSTELIQGLGYGGNVTIHEHPSPNKIHGFQVVSSLELFKPISAVRCVGSIWNSTEVLKTEPIRFPKILQSDNK